jgi:hypothetical protein
MSFTDVADGPVNPRYRPAMARIRSTTSQRPAGILINPQNDVVLSAGILSGNRIASEFQKHERKWKRDTRYTSSLSEKYLHPSYARIIGLGRAAVPFILASLQREPDDWFYALRAITGADPVRAAHAGVMPKMCEAWINWSRQRGLY